MRKLSLHYKDRVKLLDAINAELKKDDEANNATRKMEACRDDLKRALQGYGEFQSRPELMVDAGRMAGWSSDSLLSSAADSIKAERDAMYGRQQSEEQKERQHMSSCSPF